MIYTVELPLPPPDNACHRSGPYTRYATQAYRDWLGIAAPLIRAALPEGWVPDTDQWWHVQAELYLGSRGDGPNYQKALLDALSGSCVAEENILDAQGQVLWRKGQLYKPGALWDDDRRVGRGLVRVAEVRHPDPHVIVDAWPLRAAPVDRKATDAEALKAGKARARQALKDERAALNLARKVAR